MDKASLFKHFWPIKHKLRVAVFSLLLVVFFVGVFMVFRPLPDGVDITGPWRALPEVQFLRDITYVDEHGKLTHDQEIMDTMLAVIAEAESLLVLDQFLFNDFKAEETAVLRPLSSELTEAIVTRMGKEPPPAAWFITDPMNTLYGGLESPQQEQLRSAGVEVVETRLTALRDSNPLFSAWWRTFLRHWPSQWGPRFPNLLGPGSVPLRSYLDLLNFKANHRKTMIADRGGQLWGIVSSANPHDASSAHHNVAVIFRGDAALDLLDSERAVAAFSGAYIPEWSGDSMEVEAGDVAIEGRIITERAVERAALSLLDTAEPGDRVTLAMFYLSSRPIVRGLRRAHVRGVKVKVLLDANKDAFGLEKNGIPNRPVGVELHRAGIAVRWAMTQGEQFHSKMLTRFSGNGEATVLIGSSNYTRRNLKNLNLETCIEIRGSVTEPFFEEVAGYLDTIWNNRNGLKISGDFYEYDDSGLLRGMWYRIQESTGLSTF